MNQKALVRVLLIVLAVMLVLGMVASFTPLLGNLGGQNKGNPAVKVNGTVITDQDLESVRRGNPVLGLTQDGVLGDDFKTAIVESKVQETLLKQGASDQQVSRAEVNDAVSKLREQLGLKSNKEWVDRLQQYGFTDASFREAQRTQLAWQKKLKALQDATPKGTPAEAQLYYTLHPDEFKSEARIVGRQIAVSSEAKAKQLLAQAKGGADFAKLASENSTVNKDRGGALGPIENGEPKPVAKITLPAEVGEAAFALTQGGLTDVVKSGDKFYIVKVERFVPASTQPFEAVRSKAIDAVTKQKQDAAVEAWYTDLRNKANVEFVDSAWKWDDSTVATVNDQRVRYPELLTRMLSDQQLPALLQQLPPADAAKTVNGFVKPGVLDTLVNEYAASEIVKAQKLPLVGSRTALLASLEAYGARDVKITDAQVRDAYQKNISAYRTPASANISEISFASREKALAFRTAFAASPKNLSSSAARAGGTVNELGTVQQGQADQSGQPKLNPLLDKAVYDAGRLEPAGEGSLSDVVEVNGRFSLAYVRDLVRGSTKPLSEVSDQVRETLLQEARTQAGQAYLQAQLKGLKITKSLDKVLAAQEKRVAAQAPKTTPAGGTGTSGAAQGTTPATGGTSGTTNK
ncbi:peptidylprolyl isomerase [Deinococcus maricopensis]|uniref:peptidylprolyl isomerase n=1 Tax=Deinococcus maricopensis TaxID=309887 RepID=UPI0002D954C5|nr:peptidylprolyl isomerase [Deinococcus maricopensis]